MGTHLSATSATPHLLVPSEAEDWMPAEEAKDSLQACGIAMEVARFFEEERKWLQTRKAEVLAAIDKEAGSICEGVRRIAEKAKAQAEAELEKALVLLETFRSLELRERVFRVKSDKEHLVSLDFQVRQVTFQPIFLFSLHSSCENSYTNTEPSRDWIFNGADIDAVTISVSKRVTLLGVGLGRPTGPSTEVRSLKVLQGNSTKGAVLYSHPAPFVLSQKRPLVRLTQPIQLLPEQKYTLKALLAGDSIVAGNSCVGRLQEGLEVKLFSARFAAWEGSNGTNETEGVFSEFLYRPV